MPKESFTPSLQGFSYTVLIYIVMAFAPYVTVLLINLVQEKENKLKELMRIMGTSDVAYWLSWVITYAVIMFFAVLIMNAITVPGGIFGGSNYIVMVIICYLYGITIIMMSFMFTPFFKNAKSAGLFASLITTIFGAIAIPLIIVDVPNPVKWALSLFSPTAFGLAISQVQWCVELLRGERKGLRWCGFALFLVEFCGHFYSNSRYCGFKTLSGLRLLQPLGCGFQWKKCLQ